MSVPIHPGTNTHQIFVQIIVFDEGHNVEDAARECGSIDLTDSQLTSCLDDIASFPDSSHFQHSAEVSSSVKIMSDNYCWY